MRGTRSVGGSAKQAGAGVVHVARAIASRVAVPVDPRGIAASRRDDGKMIQRRMPGLHSWPMKPSDDAGFFFD